MENTRNPIYMLACLLIIIGALNWLFIGLGMGNPVEMIFGSRSRIIYIIVGFCGIFVAVRKTMNMMGSNRK